MKTLRKLKQVAPLAAIAFVLVLFGSGCSQQIAPTHTNTPLPLITTDWTDPGFANPVNPFDSIGLMHNLGMDYVYSKLAGIYDTNLEEAYECQFFQQRWGYNADTLKMLIDTLKNLEQTGSSSSVLDSLQAIWDIYPHFPIYIREVDSIASNAFLNPDSALAAIVNIEDSIVNDAFVTPTERTLGLPCVAFIRYSYAYSHDSSSTNKWPGRAQRPKTLQTFADDPAKADFDGMAGGAVGGFSAGTTIGAIGGFIGGGPVGALAGGAAGGIDGFLLGGLTGGLTASIGALGGGTGGNFWDGFWGSIVTLMFDLL